MLYIATITIIENTAGQLFYFPGLFIPFAIVTYIVAKNRPTEKPQLERRKDSHMKVEPIHSIQSLLFFLFPVIPKER